MKLEIINEKGEELVGDFERLLGNFERILNKHVAKYLGSHDGRISLVINDDESIRVINRDFRNIDKATDVISCSYIETGNIALDGDSVEVGDIFISWDTAKRQAEKKGHTLKIEMEVLFVHGLLHLFGFDHNTDEEEQEMEKWAKMILEG